MEALFYIIAVYGGLALIGWFFGQIGKWIDNNNTKIKNEATEDVLSESNFSFKKIEEYRKKLKEIGYEENQSSDWYQKYYLANGATSYSSLLGECSSCKKGNLRIIKGKYGKFIGCSSYPACHYTKDIKKAKEDYQQKSSKKFLEKLNIAYR